MRAITVVPGKAGSIELSEVAEPDESEGSVLVETLAVGVCGTDMEIVEGGYGWAPPGRERLVLGHESIGRVATAPEGSGLEAGDLVVGIVRRPDPVPCYSCAAGEWDECRNGRYQEHGIKELDGFLRERYRANPDSLVKLDPSLGMLGVLLEPTTIVAKAWEQAERIGHRVSWQPLRAVVLGAGPIGLLAALLGVQRGLEVHVIDQVSSGPKPELVEALKAHYHVGRLADACPSPDVILECTGVPGLIAEALEDLGTGGVACLAGVSPTGASVDLDLGSIGRAIVLGNKAVFGSVNANRRHYEKGSTALAGAERAWLERLVSRVVPLEDFEAAFRHNDGDVKVVLEIGR
jgi:threonine dehydrogenase-like Zn-dependent dehydrogenase